LKRFIRRQIKKLSAYILNKHFIYIARHPANNNGFVMVGGLKPLARYSKLYLGLGGKATVSKKLILNAASRLNHLLKTYGMVVSADDKILSAEDSLSVPDFIDVGIDLPEDINTYLKGLPYTARYDVRKIERAGFKCQVFKDDHWVPVFYNTYYQPTMQKRHGDEAYIMPQTKIKALMAQGDYEFAKILDGDTCVGAVLAKIEAEQYHFFKVGWLNGDDSLITKGATAALYWFVINRAFELNKTRVVLGGTPAYLENGVFRYKAKWLASLNTRYYGLNGLFLNPGNQHCYNFLLQVSIIAVNKNGDLIVLSAKAKDNAGVTGIILNNITAWYLLRDTPATTFNIDVACLPPALRPWYQKVV